MLLADNLRREFTLFVYQIHKHCYFWTTRKNNLFNYWFVFNTILFLS